MAGPSIKSIILVNILMIIILDTNILGYLTNPNSSSPEISQCQDWLYRMLSKGKSIYSSDICDYELRRELLRIDGIESVRELDELRGLITFCPIDIDDLRRAAELWSDSRNRGQPNKDQQNIDVDCILAAQCLNLRAEFPGRRVVLATTNIRDFAMVPDCELWQDIG